MGINLLTLSVPSDDQGFGGKYSTELSRIGHIVAVLIEFWQYGVLPHVSITVTANMLVTSIICLFIALKWIIR